MIFSLANPSGIAFWSGIGIVMLSGLGEAGGPGGATAIVPTIGLILACLFSGMVLSCVFVALAAWGGRVGGERLMRWVDLASGVALSYFGVRLLWTRLRRTLPWIRPA